MKSKENSKGEQEYAYYSFIPFVRITVLLMITSTMTLRFSFLCRHRIEAAVKEQQKVCRIEGLKLRLEGEG